jgi:hypothetical protein
MNSNKLKEMKQDLSALPILEERMKKLQSMVALAEENLNRLLSGYEKESMDVERLKKDTFSTTLLKFTGKYDNKMDKETREMLDTKIEYDKAIHLVKELSSQFEEIGSRISGLRVEKRIYEAEIKSRKQLLLSEMDNDISKKYKELEKECELLRRQIVEIDESITAANRVKSTASSALKHLKSAENLANYDVWMKGGILIHMAKYEHIDDAEESFNRLSSQLKDLKKELLDIDMIDILGVTSIDSITRIFDYWFDNIFTDSNVLDQIRKNMVEIARLIRKIDEIITKVLKKKEDDKIKVRDIENRMSELLISSN